MDVNSRLENSSLAIVQAITPNFESRQSHNTGLNGPIAESVDPAAYEAWLATARPVVTALLERNS